MRSTDEPGRSRPLPAFHLGAPDVEHVCNPADLKLHLRMLCGMRTPMDYDTRFAPVADQ